MSILRHRPHGIEHPYAVSADQRVPVLPLLGQPVRLGLVVDDPTVTDASLRCEWVDPSGTSLELTPVPARASAADVAALAGGEGHLASAQAGLLGDDGWSVTTPALEQSGVHRYRFVATLPDGSREETGWFEVEGARWVDTLPAGLEGVLTADEPGTVSGVEWLVTGRGVHRARFRLPLAAGEHVVGFGERYDALDQRGRALDAVVFEQYKSQAAHRRTYLPMPFAHVVPSDGSTGWGFHVRTSRRTWFDVGVAEPEHIVVEVALGGSASESVDVALHRGAPVEVLRAFLDEVGRAEELPDWVLRLWASGNEWNTQALVLERLDRHRELDVPVGVVVIEAWSDEEGIMIFRDAQYAPRPDGSPFALEDFTFPADGAWPDPKGLVAELHSRGIKVLLWQIPLLKTAATEDGLGAQVLAEGDALVASGHVVHEGDGSAYVNRGWWFPKSLLPDLSTEQGRRHWTAKRDHLVADLDIDGFKTDGGEHAWGHDLAYGDGRRGDEGNNLYPVHYARAFGDLLRRHGKAPVTFSRSGFTGSQAHGIFWAGDEDSTWEAFRASVTAGLTAASCGIVYWGWDLAGFSGPVPTAELYLRATAASTFMPVMQYHSEFNHHQRPLRDRTPWHVAEQTGDERVVPVFRRFAHLRERLQPYLAESARIAVETDRPFLRPLFFEDPAPQAWDFPHQWLLGDDLLVAPVVTEGAETVRAWLPEGDWVDAWTGTRVDGGRAVERHVAIDEIAVWCRASAWDRLGPVFAAGVAGGEG